VLDVIRGRSYEEAVAMLEYMPYKACEPLLMCLTSAGANGKNGKGVPLSKQYIAEAYADQGPVMKRFRPRAQGRCVLLGGLGGVVLGEPRAHRSACLAAAPLTAGRPLPPRALPAGPTPQRLQDPEAHLPPDHQDRAPRLSRPASRPPRARGRAAAAICAAAARAGARRLEHAFCL
jgi:hypothetical protein